MKKWIAVSIAVICAVSVCRAGLITHTDYLPNGIITATGQNTNENTIITEFNGNIESNNIKDGTITTSDISASAGITLSQMASTVQSSSTYVFSTAGFMASYRRPTLVYVNGTTVDIENNTGTSNQTCVIFPDSERRCVTENTGSTSVNRRAILTETASTSGTKNSGLRVNYNLTNNTWYSFYIVKAADTSDFVIIADTVTPTQANYSALNTFYGTNSWVYVEVLPYGNWANSPSNIPLFSQSGHYTSIYGPITMNSGNITTGTGIALSSAPFISGLANWTYAAGFDLSAHQIPNQVTLGNLICYMDNNTDTNLMAVTTKTTGRYLWAEMLTAGSNILANPIVPISGINLTEGITLAGAGTGGGSGVLLVGYYDNVLGVGFNPQL